MLKEIIFHIGSNKTGSSSIQLSLATNPKILFKNNYTYYTPNPFKRLSIQDINNNAYFPFESNSSNLIYKRLPIFIEKIKKNVKTDKLIISSETAFYMPDNEMKFALKELKKISHSIKLVAYLRRQDKYAISMYCQSLKVKNHINFINGTLCVDNVFNSKKNINHKMFDYYKKIKFISSLIPKDNIVIRPFERSQLINHDVVDDFYNILGIKKGFYKTSMDSNAPLSYEDIIKLKCIYGTHLSAPVKKYYIMKYSKKINEKFTTDKKSARVFYTIFKESNRMLKEEFGGSKEENFFDENFDSYPERISYDHQTNEIQSFIKKINHPLVSLFSEMILMKGRIFKIYNWRFFLLYKIFKNSNFLKRYYLNYEKLQPQQYSIRHN